MKWAMGFSFAALMVSVVVVFGCSREKEHVVARRVYVPGKKAEISPEPTYRTSWALLVGVNTYPHLPAQYQLNYAVNDVQELKEVLIEQYQFPRENITILTNEQATHENLRQVMGQFADPDQVGLNDRVLVYFSGHGQTVNLPQGGEIGFILPYDAKVNPQEVNNPSPYYTTCLGMDELKRLSDLIPAKHVLFLMDACYSGLAISGTKGLKPSIPHYLDTVAKLRARQMITGGLAGEQATEKSEWGHGAFTYKLLEALRTGVADTNQDGVITGLELAGHLRNVVPKIAPQTPQFGYFEGEGEFLFLREDSEALAKTEQSISPRPAVDLSGKSDVRILKGHSERVTAVTFSPDGMTLASGSWDGTVKLWDVQGGEEKKTLRVNGGHVCSIAFGPDSRILATGSEDCMVKLWDTHTGELKRTLKGHIEEVWWVAFSPDGKTLASGSMDSTVKTWDVATGKGKRTLSGHLGSVLVVAFSPDGKTLASGSSDGTVRLWEVNAGRVKRTLMAHHNWVSSVAFSPDDTTLASGSGDGTVKLWDALTGDLKRTLEGHRKGVRSIAFSPDGKILASASRDKTVRLWDVQTGTLQQTITGHTRVVWSVTFSPDGKTLASGSDRTVRLWRVRKIMPSPREEAEASAETTQTAGPTAGVGFNREGKVPQPQEHSDRAWRWGIPIVAVPAVLAFVLLWIRKRARLFGNTDMPRRGKKGRIV
jgi:uncharacterized caspase-like protein